MKSYIFLITSSEYIFRQFSDAPFQEVTLTQDDPQNIDGIDAIVPISIPTTGRIIRDITSRTKYVTMRTLRSQESLWKSFPQPDAMILFPTHKELGGGFLFRGHQEEERTYMRYPELSAILLLTHSIEDNEVILVKGCKRLNEVSGSGPTLKWVGRSIKTDLREVPKNFTVVIICSGGHVFDLLWRLHRNARQGAEKLQTMLLGIKPAKFSKPKRDTSTGALTAPVVLDEQLQYDSLACELEKLR